VIDHPPTHVVVKIPGMASHIDIHYPRASALAALVRSDFTVNGIGFRWAERKIEDPLGGEEDFKNRKLRIHSPQYIVTDAPTFFRMFRTAVNLGFELDAPTQSLIRRFSPLASLHRGRTNVRTLFEFLKFLSLPKIGPWFRQMNRCGLIEGLFPELAIPACIMISQEHSILSRNVELAIAVENMRTAPEVATFLDTGAGVGITNRGIVRLVLLFFELGRAYHQLEPRAPYVRSEAGNDAAAFASAIESRLLGFIAARYSEAAGVPELLRDVPGIFSGPVTGESETSPYAAIVRGILEAASRRNPSKKS
jgi:hypothetical protein